MSKLPDALTAEVAGFSSPEQINLHRDTSPSLNIPFMKNDTEYVSRLVGKVCVEARRIATPATQGFYPL